MELLDKDSLNEMKAILFKYFCKIKRVERLSFFLLKNGKETGLFYASKIDRQNNTYL